MDVPLIIAVAVEPRAATDQQTLDQALNRLAAEDPIVRVRLDHRTGQTIIAGVSEIHLEILVDRLEGLPGPDDGTVEAPVMAPRTPTPGHWDPGVALPEPDDD
jgi:hypothetical protein